MTTESSKEYLRAVDAALADVEVYLGGSMETHVRYALMRLRDAVELLRWEREDA